MILGAHRDALTALQQRAGASCVTCCLGMELTQNGLLWEHSALAGGNCSVFIAVFDDFCQNPSGRSAPWAGPLDAFAMLHRTHFAAMKIPDHNDLVRIVPLGPAVP